MKEKRVGPAGGEIVKGMPEELTDRMFLDETWRTFGDKLGYVYVDGGPISVYCHSGNDAVIFAFSGLNLYVPMTYMGHSTYHGLETGINMRYNLRRKVRPMALVSAILKMHEINNGEYRLRGWRER